MVKLGLGESYGKVNILSKKGRAYLDITKPASTVGITLAFMVGLVFYLLYNNQNPNLVAELDTILYASITVGLAHGASQALNMAEDAEMDRNTPHKQNRPIPAGIITEEEARTIAWIMILAAVGRAYITSTTFGIVMSLSVFMGVFYNLEPIRAKERIISIPWQAVSRGLLMFPAVWSVYGNPLDPFPVVMGVFMFFYVFGFQNTADIIDHDVDKEYGIKTLAVVLGPHRIPLVASISMMFMALTLNYAASWANIIPDRFVFINLILLFCLWMIYLLKQNPTAVSEKTGNHPAWLWYYAGMVLCVLIPFSVELLV
jgi:4-hydroxybenzoate polyprenyltransferase